MVVCKYFQQGWCRYGQSCRFEHVYSSKYSYHAQAPSTQQTKSVADEELINVVQADIQSALNGKQWILSCYSPHKEKACFPGISDLSQEEARLIIYEARANNTLDQAINYMNNLFKDARQKYQQLLQPSAQIIKVLKSLYKGEPVTSPFGTSSQGSIGFGSTTSQQPTGFGSNASSVFRSAVQSDPFKSNNTPFGQQSNTSVFARTDNASGNAFGTNPKSIFAQASQNLFGPTQPSNIFQTQPQQNIAAKSIFAQANHSTFGQQQQQQNVFEINQPSNTTQQQNPFGVQQNTLGVQRNPFSVQENQTANVFQQNDPFKVQGQNNNADIFGVSQNPFQQQTADDENVYSKMEDLSPSDLEAFNAADFKLGFIPVLPPPVSLCR